MKHIKYYATVKRHLKAYFDREMKQAKHDLGVLKRCFGNPKCWDEKDQNYRTDEATKWRAAGHQVSKDDIESEELRLQKSLPKERKYWEDRLEAAGKAGKLIEINISVNWTKSRTWGWNPHAECWMYFEDAEYGTRSAYSEGRASGCGYDKRSAAVQGAFEFGVSKRYNNADERKDLALARASFDRFVIEHGPKLWKEYAIDKSPMPTFNISGKGMGTFTSLFRKIGTKPYSSPATVKDYLIDYSERARDSDTYHVIRKDMV